MKQKLYMLVGSMNVNKGGITQAILNRSKMLRNDYDVSILTMDFKKNYTSIIEQLTSAGKLDHKVSFLNLYDYYRKKFSSKKLSRKKVSYYKKQNEQNEKGLQVVMGKKYARYFENGVYIKYKKWDNEGNLIHIDFFNKYRNRIFREEFFSNGLLYKKTFFDLNKNTPVQESFFTEDGFCFLIKWYNSHSSKLQKIFLVDPTRDTVKEFNSKTELNSFWIKELSVNEKKKPIVITDGPGSVRSMLPVDSKYIYKIFMIHTNHFAYPHTVGSEIKKNLKHGLENIKNLDALILLTETQKKDIINQFNNHGNITVIPHAVKLSSKLLASKRLKKDKIVSIVARYDPIKRIDHSIYAFKKVVKKVPNAKLNIYGIGSDYDRLNQIIINNNLSNNVFLKGYINDVESVFLESNVSLLTSRYEGFSLVIIESYACSTPVISYNVPYGPNDIIQDKKSGFLIKDGNIDDLANKITYLLKNPKEASKMGRIGFKHLSKNNNYKQNHYKWLKLLKKFK